MKLIVGLGNPGSSYLMTRHNAGFMTIDALSENSFVKKHNSLIQRIAVAEKPALLAKPQTYMNLSGAAVCNLLAFYKIPLKDLLVVQDDVDQPFLKMKFQKNRGHGGHNGIRNIHDCLKTPDYARLKLGVGRPNPAMEKSKESAPPVLSTSDYVLSSFSEREQADLKLFLETALQAVMCFIEKGFEKSAEKFNRQDRKYENLT